MWPHCLRLGVAAITYEPLTKTDLSKYQQGEPAALWDKLKPTQKASLRRFVYEMKPGDVIYVKQGPMIIDKGIVTEPYKFDQKFRIVDPYGTPWAHQVPVRWSKDFKEKRMLLGGEQVTVMQLSPAQVARIERVGSTPGRRHDLQPDADPQRTRLLEDAYYRESAARLKVIIPRHNRLSNSLCQWLKRVHSVDARQEHRRIDVQVSLGSQTILAELKVCFGVGPKKSIREALGQLLEYNYYPSRKAADVWWVVLDEAPSDSDKNYIDRLRTKRSLPLSLGWRSGTGFSFYPRWGLGGGTIR
jgi:hypothetical protein